MRHRAFAFLTLMMSVFLVLLPACRSDKRDEATDVGKETKKDTKPRMVRNPLKKPEETVKAYLDLDGQGKRLTSKTWSKVLPYISWQEEAGWDAVTVITGYEIARMEKKKDGSVGVTVKFDVAGSLSSEYRSARSIETVVFTVKMTDAGWKIIEPDTFRPHVLVNPLVTHLEETREHELAHQVQTGGRP